MPVCFLRSRKGMDSHGREGWGILKDVEGRETDENALNEKHLFSIKERKKENE